MDDTMLHGIVVIDTIDMLHLVLWLLSPCYIWCCGCYCWAMLCYGHGCHAACSVTVTVVMPYSVTVVVAVILLLVLQP